MNNTIRTGLVTLASVLALGAAATAGAQDKPGDTNANVDLLVDSPPPKPKVEHAPPAQDGMVWVDGYWAWIGGNHGHYKWNPGRMEPVRTGYHWQAHEWQKEPDGRYQLHGGWIKD